MPVVQLHHPDDRRFEFITDDKTGRSWKARTLMEDPAIEATSREETVGGKRLDLIYTKPRFGAADCSFGMTDKLLRQAEISVLEDGG